MMVPSLVKFYFVGYVIVVYVVVIVEIFQLVICFVTFLK